MRDPRALANLRNLGSYRAWEQESIRRSGLNMFALIVAVSTPMFTGVAALIEHWARGDAAALARLMEAAVALYIAALGGWMLLGVLRQRAWKRAHPWAPPSPARQAS